MVEAEAQMVPQLCRMKKPHQKLPPVREFLKPQFYKKVSVLELAFG